MSALVWHFLPADPKPEVLHDVLLAYRTDEGREVGEGWLDPDGGGWTFSTGHEVLAEVYAWAELPAAPAQLETPNAEPGTGGGAAAVLSHTIDCEPAGVKLRATRNDDKRRLTLSIVIGARNVEASVALDAKAWNDLHNCTAYPPRLLPERRHANDETA